MGINQVSQKNRLEAIAIGATTYHGNPCKNCGGTERKIAKLAGGSCVLCKKRWNTDDAQKARLAKWAAENPEKRRIKNSRRRKSARRKCALNDIYRKQVAKIFLNCPDGFHVDHIVPLTSAKVCGLNVPWNLEYIEPKQNQSKGNRWWPDMFGAE